MNPSDQEPVKWSGFVPLLLLALAFITVGNGAVIRDRSQVQALKTQVEQLDHVNRSSLDADTALQFLLSNLLHLAELDGDAKAILTKYGLQVLPSAPSPEASR